MTLVAVAVCAILIIWRRPVLESVDELVAEAVAAAEHDDYATAVLKLDAVLAQQPDHSEALLYRGQAAHHLGQSAEARQFFARVPDHPPRFASTARYAEGVLAVEQGFSKAGEHLLRRSAQLNPSYLQPHDRLVELYAVQMRRDDIRRELDEIRRLRPWRLEELALYSMANERTASPTEGIRQMQRFLEVEPGDARHLFALAQYQIDAEQFAGAETTLQQLLALEAESARAAAMLAELKLRQDDVNGAVRALARANPTWQPDVWFYRTCGRLWLRQGDWQMAANCLAEAARLDPEDLTAAHQLGTAVSRIHPAAAAPLLQRAQLMDQVIRQAARIPARDHSQIRPLVVILVDVAESLIRLERFREAVFWFDQVMMLDPAMLSARQRIADATERWQRQVMNPSPSAYAPPAEASVSWTALVDRVQHELRRLPADTREFEVAGQTGVIRLRDVHQAAGINFQYYNGQTGLKYLVESMGGGVAVLDFDLDGWPDAYFPQGCELPYDPKNVKHLDRLYRNRGDGTYEDVTQAAGLGDNRYGQGCTVADFDNDGDPDLFVANFGQSVLYQNNGDGTFDDVTDAAGIQGERWSSSAGFADFDRDGLLDLYVCNYVDSLRVCRGTDGHVATCDPGNFNAEQDRLYRNRGDGTFDDATTSSGIVAAGGKGLGLVLADLDNDGATDVYVANDGTPNFLFRNVSQPGQLLFLSIGQLAGVAVNGDGQAEGGMGIACADFQNDGLLDLYVTNFIDETNTFYENLGNMFFDDATRHTSVAAMTRPMVGFGTQPIDFDFDGWPDLLVANGHIDDFRFRKEPWKMPTQLFRNIHGGRFVDASHQAGPYFAGEFLGRGVARVDFDRDGDQDVFVVHQDAPLALLRNDTVSSGHWLAFELHGVVSSRDAIGTRIEIRMKSGVRILELSAGDGFFSSNERRCVIGLGEADRIDEVVIRWPSGLVQSFASPAVDTVHVLVEGRGPLKAV